MNTGRPRIPIAEKIARLKGEEQKRLPPLPFDWPNPFDPELDEEACWAWDFVVQDCAHRGVLANGDRNVVYEYCVMYQRALRAAKEYDRVLCYTDDMGSLKNHPALRAEESSWDRCRKIGALLGLDPINRNKPLLVGSAELGIADGTSPTVIDLIAFGRDRTLPPPWERDSETESAEDGSA